MARLDHAISVTDLPKDETPDFSPLPEGTYTTTIQKCEVKDSKNGGEYFNFQLSVNGGEFDKRFIFGMVTKKNANEKAEAIGHGQLRTIMESCGVATLTDTDQLIGGLVEVRVAVEEYNGTKRNVIKGWKVGAPSFNPATNVAMKATPPWGKK